MAKRQTLNVSLPPAQEQFVRAQVDSGRYQSASEVVRDGLRLLEKAEHQRLLEKWLHEGLTEEEEAALPPDLIEWAKARVAAFLDEGMEDFRQGRAIDGPEAMRRIRDELEGRRMRESA